MHARTLGEFSFGGGAECSQCGADLPGNATAEQSGDAVVVTCPTCGYFTGVKVLTDEPRRS